jgi:hypothetical protein
MEGSHLPPIEIFVVVDTASGHARRGVRVLLGNKLLSCRQRRRCPAFGNTIAQNTRLSGKF